MADLSRSELLAGLASLYHSRDWSDLVLCADYGSEHPVHRAIVCPRSPYISAAVRERRWRDGVEGHLALPESDNVISQMVEYFYHLDYHPEGPVTLDPSYDTHDDSQPTDSQPSIPSNLHPAINGGLVSGTSTLSSIDTLSNRPEHVGHYGPSSHHYSCSVPAVMSAYAGPISPPLQSSFDHHHSNPSPVSALSGTFSTRDSGASSLTAHALPARDRSPRGPAADPWYLDSPAARPMKHVSTAPLDGGGIATTARKPVGRAATVAPVGGTKMPGTSAHRHVSNPPPTHHHPHLPPPEPSPLATDAPYLVLHAKVFSAAVRYGMPGLRALALDKFKIQLTRHWDTPAFAACIPIVFAREREAEPPAGAASTFPGPAGAAALTHYQQHRELREAVADALGWHPRLLDKPEIEAAVLEIDGLAYELLKRSRRRVEGPEYE